MSNEPNNLAPEEEEIGTQEEQVEEQDDVSQTEDDQSESEESYETEEVDPENYNRLRTKVSKVESRLNEASETLKGYQEYVLKSEDRTRDWFQSQGLSEEDTERALARIKEQRPDLWQESTKGAKGTPTINEKLSPEEIEGAITQKVMAQIQQQQTLSEVATYMQTEREGFFKEVPDMDPANYVDASPEDRELIAEFADKVDLLAQRFVEIKEGTSYKDALVKSYKILSEELGLGGEKEDGYLEGLADATADEASTFGGTSGGASTGSASYGPLTAPEKEIARKLGMTESDYAKYKR